MPGPIPISRWLDGTVTAVTLTVLIASDAVAGVPVTLFSARERNYVARFRQSTRRRDSAAARLAAKWAFLRFCGDSGSPPHQGAACLCRVGADDFLHADAERIGRIEIVTPDDCPGTRPRFHHGGRDVSSDIHVSLAHAGGVAGVMVGRRGPVGLDIEPYPPDDAGDIDPCSDPDGKLSEPALWTVKEALLKTGAIKARTIWELLDLDVTLDVSAPDADGIFKGGTFRQALRPNRRYLATGPGLPKSARIEVTLTRRSGLLITRVEVIPMAEAAGPNEFRPSSDAAPISAHSLNQSR
jgi:hypothetical protein